MSILNATNAIEVKAKAWWTFPYVWMVLMGPVLVVIAALWTAFVAHQGADQVLLGETKTSTLSPDQVKKNHATTRTYSTHNLPMDQPKPSHVGDKHE
jgi:hypothetical protein